MSPPTHNHGKVTAMTADADAPAEPDPQETRILAELADCETAIAEAEDARKRRLELWIEARSLDPKITYARLAAASNVAEPYVIRVTGKALAEAGS